MRRACAISSRPSEQPPGPDFGRLFEIEQRFLAVETSCVAGQLAVFADDPVARNHDAERIAADGGPDFLRCGPIREFRREFTVGDGLAVRDRRQPVPYPTA